MIGIIADTHWPPGSGFTFPSKKRERIEAVEKQILGYFEYVDFIIHAGDVGDPEILDFLETISKVYLVKGNRDPSFIRGVELPKYLILEYKGKKIGVTHGSGSPKNIIERSINPILLPHNPDIIVYGHTHKPFKKMINGILYVNPGSAGDTFFTKENWVVTLDVTDGVVNVNFHRIKIP